MSPHREARSATDPSQEDANEPSRPRNTEASWNKVTRLTFSDLVRLRAGRKIGIPTMANRYGEAALMAVRQASSGKNPVAQWESAMNALYPTSQTARRKGCPRGAFLGLCEEGLVKGVTAGHYTKSRDNKDYAVRAAKLLISGTRTWSKTSLWLAVTKGAEKVHNSQMDVVIALWKNGLLVTEP
jgi:hypothetical protein